MIDTELMVKEFLERRQSYCEKHPNLEPGDKGYLNPNPQLLMVTYKNGNGGMVIDQAELNRLPKASQNKIFTLHKI